MTEFLSQAIRQLQYTALLGNLDVPMPEPLRKFFDIFNVLNIDPVLILGRTAIPDVTFRIIFFLVGCCVPMIINILLLVISKPWFVVMWYWVLLAGFLLIFVGVLGRFLPGTSAGNLNASESLAIVGGAMAGAALLIFAVNRILVYLYPDEFELLSAQQGGTNSPDSDDDELEMSEDKKRRLKNMSISDLKNLDSSIGRSASASRSSGGITNNSIVDLNGTLGGTGATGNSYKDAETLRERATFLDAKKFHRKRTMTHIVVTFVLTFVGLLMTGIISISAPGVTKTTKEEFDSSTFKVIGYVLLGFGGISFIYMVAHTFKQGRVGAYKFVRFLQQNMLRMLILIVLLTFIPIVSYCVDTYMCTTYECPAGTIFNPNANRPVGSYSKDPSYFCDECKFNQTRQPQCTAGFETERCPAFSEKRLFSDPGAVCNDDGYAYVVIAATIILLTFIVGVPLLFYTVTTRLHDKITLQVQIVDDANPDEEERLENEWQKRQAFCPVVFGSIYAPFTLKMKYYMLLDLAQRFLFVIFLQIIAPFTSIASALVLGCHVIFFFAVLYVRPYADASLQGFASLLAFANVVNSALIVVLWARGDADGLLEFAYVAIAINAAISVVGGAILAWMQFKAQQTKTVKYEEEEQEAEEKRLDDVENQESHAEFDREQAKEDIIQAAEDRKRTNATVTTALNNTTMDEMSNKFMIMGIIVCIASALAVLGILREPESPYRVGSDILFLTPQNQIAGYSSWSNFTENCCCSPGTATFDDYNVTERWACKNGLTVTRGRQSANGVDNGLLVRTLCNTTFMYNCVATVNQAINRVQVTCPDSGNKILQDLGFTETARVLYF